MSSYPLRNKLVAVSVSENEDLLVLGYSAEHLNELCALLTRSLLRLGASIAYGGILGAGNFTDTLYEVAREELETHPSKKDDSILKTPFVNYSPWPHHLKLNNEKVAREHGICRYERVDDREIPGRESDDKLDNGRRAAHASTRMRCRMADECYARIVVGGKTKNFAGLMPGILEEAMYHLKEEKPLYIVGGFGGAAGDLAKAMMRPSEDLPLPKSLNLESREGNLPIDQLLKAFPNEATLPYDVSHKDAQESYERLREQVSKARESQFESLNNGLDSQANTHLMTSEDVNEIVGLVEKGLTSIAF